MNEQTSSVSPLDQAVMDWEVRAAAQPEDMSVQLAYGDALWRRGRVGGALAVFARLERDQPDAVEAHLALAWLYRELGASPEAWRQLAQVAALAPAHAEGYVLYRMLSAGGSPPKDIAKSLAGYKKFRADTEDLAALLTRYADVQNRLAAQVADLEARVVRDPQDAVATFVLAGARARQAALRDAVQIMVDLAGDDPALQGAAAALRQHRPDEELSRRLAAVQDRIGAVLQDLAASKGVSGAALISRNGEVGFQAGKEKWDITRVGLPLLAALEAAKAWSPRSALEFLGLEFDRGLLIVQQLSPSFTLLISCQQGANFTAIRYHVEQVEPRLAEILGEAGAAGARG